VIEDHRKAISTTEEPDPVTQDMLIAQAAQLEQFQWFVRAHLENASGQLSTTGSQHEVTAARKATSRRGANA
jgi:starvation-inducible DNA-binding protein